MTINPKIFSTLQSAGITSSDIGGDPSALNGPPAPVPPSLSPAAVIRMRQQMSPQLPPTHPLYNTALSNLDLYSGPQGGTRYITDIANRVGAVPPLTLNPAGLENHMVATGWQPVPPANAQAGDVVGMSGTSPGGRHLAIYAGNGQIVGGPGKAASYLAGRQTFNPSASVVYRPPVVQPAAAPKPAADPRLALAGQGTVPRMSTAPFVPSPVANSLVSTQLQPSFGAPIVSDVSYRGQNGKQPAQIPVAPRITPKRFTSGPSVRSGVQGNQSLGGYASQAQLEAAAQADVNRQIAMSKNPYLAPGATAWYSDPGFYGQSAVPDPITGSRNYMGTPVRSKRQSALQDTKQFWTTLGGQIQGSPVWRFLGDLAATQPHNGLDPAGKAFAGRPYTMQDSVKAEQGVKDGKAAIQSVKNAAVSAAKGIAQPFVPLAHRVAYDQVSSDPYYRDHPAERARLLSQLKTDIDIDPPASDSILSLVPFGSAPSGKMFLRAGTKLLLNDPSGVDEMSAASDQFTDEGLANPAKRLTILGTVMLPFALRGMTTLWRNAATFDAIGDTAAANTARAGQQAFADHIKTVAQSSPEAGRMVHDAIVKEMNGQQQGAYSNQRESAVTGPDSKSTPHGKSGAADIASKGPGPDRNVDSNTSVQQLRIGDNLHDTMGLSGLHPTQTKVYSGKLNDFADKMRTGKWDWDVTKNTKTQPMIVDGSGNIQAGHHRFIAAQIAGVKIPEGVVQVRPELKGRVVHPWGNVVVKE